MNIDPNAYLSTPPALIRAAKNNAYYIGRLQQHLTDWDKDLTEWHESGEWKKDYKTWGAACEIALDMTRRAANHAIRTYKLKDTAVSVETGELSPVARDTAKAAVLATVNDLPDPLAELEARMPASVQSKAPAPEPQAVPERTRATPTESGKPKSKLAVWVEVEHGYGHLLPRIDELNRICPNASMHRDLLNQTKSCMESLAEWKAMVK